MFFEESLEDQKNLVEREFFLRLLDANLAAVKKQQGKNIALIGAIKTGKTVLLKTFVKKVAREKEVIPVYIDLNRMGTTPENFSIELIGNVCFWFSGSSFSDYKRFLDIEYLTGLKTAGSEFIKNVADELLKIKPDQKAMVTAAFSFVEALAKENNKKILLCIDNFENILDLNNFPQIKDIISLIPKSKIVNYVVTSSFNINLPGFTIEHVKKFNRNEITKLAEKIIGKTNKKVIDDIERFSNGNPFLAKSICDAYKKFKNVKKAFLVELTVKNSSVYNYCKEIFYSSLARARGQSLLRLILKVLAQIKEGTLTEISKKIYRSAPVTKSLLERLISVELIHKHDGKFSLVNPVLALWIKFVCYGYDFDFVPEDKILKKLEEEL